MPTMMPQQTAKEVPPSGPINGRLAIVGDFTSGFDVKANKPFSGPAGGVLETCLHAAGLIRGEVYTTNLIKERVANKKAYFNEKDCSFSSEGMQYVALLKEELKETTCPIIIAAGPASFAALCSLPKHATYRGYLFQSTLLPGRWVLPTYDPQSSIYGMYSRRYIVTADLKKAKRLSEQETIERPERQLAYSHTSCQDVLDWLAYYEEQPIVGFDIEVINYEVSCISFSSEEGIAFVAPIAGRWTLEEECQIWRAIQRVLGNEKSTKVVQNGMFDIAFLRSRCGVEVRGPIHDTMIAHSILYPELPKSLGFLGSLYCESQEYWKDTVKFKNIKGDA